MSEIITPSPALSPAFGRARKLSRVMAVIFAIAFLVMLSTLVAALAFVFFQIPNSGIGLFHGIRISLGQLRGWNAIGALAAATLFLVPCLLLLHHTRKLFGCFARGEVFAARPIAHIRAAGLWLTASFFTDVAGLILLRYSGINQHISPLEFLGLLFAGVTTTIAAYVMEEARRIAADHAEIV